MSQSLLIRILSGVLLAAPAAMLLAQPFDQLATPEFLVNTFEEGDQRIPIVASDDSGNSVIIWQSRNQDLPGWSIYAQRLDEFGDRIGEEFRINVFNDGSQDGHHLAMDDDGSFVVVWNGPDRTSASDVISLRHFGSNGMPLAGDRRVSETLSGTQILPRLGLTSDGRTLVAWEAQAVAGATFNIVARTLDSDGQPLSPIVPVNQLQDGAQRRVDIAVGDDGSRVVAWQDAVSDGNDWGIFVRCLDASGDGADEIQVNQTTAGLQYRPRLARTDDGRFAVVWQDTLGQSSFVYRRVMLRRFDADCQPAGPETQVNQFDEGIQDLPEIGLDGDGHYVIVWQSFPEDFEQQGIYGRRMTLAGEFLGDEFAIHQEIEAYQDFPTVSGLPDGGFIVTWESAGQDESGFGIYARRFLGPAPARLELLGGGNQQTEVGQTFAEPIVLELADQWGSVLVGETLLLATPDNDAGVLFSNGSNQIELQTDSSGQVSVPISANALAGEYMLTVTALATGLVRLVPLENLSGSGASEPIPVPAGSAWAWFMLMGLVVLFTWRVGLVSWRSWY